MLRYVNTFYEQFGNNVCYYSLANIDEIRINVSNTVEIFVRKKLSENVLKTIKKLLRKLPENVSKTNCLFGVVCYC